jgi:hypothetical protein
MAGELLATRDAEQAQLSQRKPCKRLTAADLGLLLKLRADGLTQAAIAQRLDCDQAAVNRWLMQLTDTSDVAKSFLRGHALSMAQNIVKKGRAADHVKTLEGIEVLSNQDVKGGLTIVIGSGSSVQLNVGSVGLSPSDNVVKSESMGNP